MSGLFIYLIGNNAHPCLIIVGFRHRVDLHEQSTDQCVVILVLMHDVWLIEIHRRNIAPKLKYGTKSRYPRPIMSMSVRYFGICVVGMPANYQHNRMFLHANHAPTRLQRDAMSGAPPPPAFHCIGSRSSVIQNSSQIPSPV